MSFNCVMYIFSILCLENKFSDMKNFLIGQRYKLISVQNAENKTISFKDPQSYVSVEKSVFPRCFESSTATTHYFIDNFTNYL